MTKASKDISSKVIISLLKDWVEQKGLFTTLVTDGAMYNQSKEIEAWCSTRGIQQAFSPPHSHKSLGLVERFQRTLLDRMRKMKMQNGGSWTDWVEKATYEINTMVHSTTQWTPQQLWDSESTEWRKALKRSGQRRNEANKYIKRKIEPLHPGDLVLLWDSVRTLSKEDKFSALWKGPFRIVHGISTRLWQLSPVNNPQSVDPTFPKGGRKPKMIVHIEHLQKIRG